MSLLLSEGWKQTAPLRCLCPKCGSELSSNAFARNTHKKKCAGWSETRDSSRNATDDALPQTTTPAATLAARDKRPASLDLRPAPRVPVLEKVVSRPAWTRFQVAGVNEYVRHLPQGTNTFLRLRVRRIGMNDRPRYTAYRGTKYLGEYDSVEVAMDAAEKG